jgi:hypothetical protein
MKHASAAAALVALTLALPSCGGEDSKDSSTAAAGATGQAEQGQSDAQAGAKDSSSGNTAKKNGSGGSSAADANRAAGENGNKSKSGSSGASKPKKKSSADKNLSPAEQLDRLPADERRALEHDLYMQGKDYCSSFGPERLAEDNHITATDPAAIAEQYAKVREQALPALILPFQQGCLAGFKRYARNPAKD